MKTKTKLLTLLTAGLTLVANIIAFGAKPNPKKYVESAQATATLNKIYDALNNKYPNITKNVKDVTWCAHQGYEDLAPGNSAAAFVLAGMCGATLCEGDVRLTSDGYPYMIHTSDLSTMTSKKKGTLIEQTPNEKVKDLYITKKTNASVFSGMKLCSFRNYLEICKAYGMLPYVHVKDVYRVKDQSKRAEGMKKIKEAIYDTGMQNKTVLCSHDYEPLKIYREYDQGVKIFAMKKIDDGVWVNETDYNNIKKLTNRWDGASDIWKHNGCTGNPERAGIPKLSLTAILNSNKETSGYSLSMNGIDISKAKVKISECIYNGCYQAPVLTVNLGGAELEKGNEGYSQYGMTKQAGPTSVRIFGRGVYTGEKRIEYNIKPASIESASIGAIANQAYTGGALTPNPTVTWIDGNGDAKTLKKGSAYSVSYSDNVKAGTATATIEGIGNFCEKKKIKFKIEKASIGNASVSVENKVYDGKPKEVVLKYKGLILTKGTDYAVKYAGSNTNVGTVTATITGKGNFTGTRTEKFEIKPASVAKADVTKVPTCEYDGTKLCPEPVFKRDGRTLVKDKDYALAYARNLNAGEGVIKVTGIGNYTGTGSVTFTISAVNLANSGKVSRNNVFDMNTLKLKTQMKFKKNGYQLKEGKDFVVEYGASNGKTKGRAVIKGIGNFTGKITYDYQVDKDGYFNIMEAA